MRNCSAHPTVLFRFQSPCTGTNPPRASRMPSCPLLLFFLAAAAALCGSVAGELGDEHFIGCGGFVKSGFAADFTKIEMQLLSKTGAVKHTTECAPNNGYFLMVLYEKGEFVLKVKPPEGWIVTPQSVTLKIDGFRDPCSTGKDINFELLGFSIYGQVVSLGLPIGPSGVAITLSAPDGVKETLTVEDGKYSFEGVVPGKYSVSASHPVWDVSKESIDVVVVDTSAVVPVKLNVIGFDVKGIVLSQREPVSDVLFLLYPQGNEKISCSVKDIPRGTRDTDPSCAAKSDNEGVFVFPSLPPGSYLLVPYYRHDLITFEVQPAELAFAVHNSSVTVLPSFEVQGFSVSGKVVNASQGQGIAGAKVFVNGDLLALTDTDGSYQLFNISTGTYQIQVEAPKLFFEPREVHVSPVSPHIPAITPTKYAVCGQVLVPVPPSQSITASQRAVRVVKEKGSEVAIATETTDQSGTFCVMLPPGEFRMEVVVSEEERGWGLTLEPRELSLVVTDSPIAMATCVFSQFTTSLSGTVSCIGGCVEMAVSLSREGRAGRGQQLKAKVGPKGQFSFSNVLPGQLRVSIDYPLWCWREDSVVVEVGSHGDKDTTVNFVQTGYSLECTTSHSITMTYFTGNETETSVELAKGAHKLCLHKPGVYTLKPKSCHIFDPTEYSFDTSSPSVVKMHAHSHHVSASIVAPKSTGSSVQLLVRSLRFSQPPITLSPRQSSGDKDNHEMLTHHFTFAALPGDDVELIPKSSELMFVPEKVVFTVTEDCPEIVPPFEGSHGVILSGRVDPPLEGVAVLIDFADPSVDDIHVITDARGVYRTAPIHDHGLSEFTTTAVLEGYVLEHELSDSFNFKAFKLSQLIIQVRDVEGVPLASVLISLSGDNFRSNNFTDSNGTLAYMDLSPGQYYVKALLREYEFLPPSKVVELQQGHHEELLFTGQRVAFGCSGRVMSLNRQPQEGVRVEVHGVEGSKCESHSDATVSGGDGTYKLRGLEPGCEYTVAVRADAHPGGIERSIPASRGVELGHSDAEGLDFIVFYAAKNVFVTGNIISKPEYLGTLKRLYSVGVSNAGFFSLPPIAVNAEATYQLAVGSTLSSYFFNFSTPETTVTADKDHHITLLFNAEERTHDKEGRRGSFLAIIIVVAVIAGLALWENIFVYLSGLLSGKHHEPWSSATSVKTGRKR